MILNQSQFEAVHSAMCALNLVGGRLDASLPAGETQAVRVLHEAPGEVVVTLIDIDPPGASTADVEVYESQHAFQQAYAA
jgi:hypothetical protein